MDDDDSNKDKCFTTPSVTTSLEDADTLQLLIWANTSTYCWNAATEAGAGANAEIRWLPRGCEGHQKHTH